MAHIDTSRSPAGLFGPFRPDVDRVERVAGLRALAAFSAVFAGSDHVVVDLLRRAETDAGALDQALTELDRLPSLWRRRVIASYARLMRPRPRRAP
jgi:hypothetical protein